MKKLSTLVLLVVLIAGQSVAQSCNQYFIMDEGVRTTYDILNSKNKVTSRSVHYFKNVSGTANNKKATLAMEIIDMKKETVVNTVESEWSCVDGVMTFTASPIGMEGIDMSNTSIDVKIEGDQMDLPSSFQVGQTLKDVNYRVKVGMSGMNFMDRTFQVKNRKVEARENVTTPAGTFDCFKLTYTTESQGKMGSSKPIQTAVWYSANTGMIKTESYKDGKVETTQLLTKIEK